MWTSDTVRQRESREEFWEIIGLRWLRCRRMLKPLSPMGWCSTVFPHQFFYIPMVQISVQLPGCGSGFRFHTHQPSASSGHQHHLSLSRKFHAWTCQMTGNGWPDLFLISLRCHLISLSTFCKFYQSVIMSLDTSTSKVQAPSSSVPFYVLEYGNDIFCFWANLSYQPLV